MCFVDGHPCNIPTREHGGGDHDQPYRFGQPPTADRRDPFGIHEFARLLLFKLRVRPDGVLASAADRLDEPPSTAPGD